MKKNPNLLKPLFTLIFVFSMLSINAQRLVRSKNTVEKKWLKNQAYQMMWYALRDTTKFEIGKVITEINKTDDRIMVVTRVSMKQSPVTWIDTTIANASDLQPIRHSSQNAQRDIVLNFGKTVSGFYSDKINKNVTAINDITDEGYFDSNLYPTLITWLPLKEGMRQDIAIYDYSPGGKSGVMKASVQEVKKGVSVSSKSGVRDVWIVSVTDEIGGGQNGASIYYIDVADRKLWKQEINAGGRKMLMQLVENDK